MSPFFILIFSRLSHCPLARFWEFCCKFQLSGFVHYLDNVSVLTGCSFSFSKTYWLIPQPLFGLELVVL